MKYLEAALMAAAAVTLASWLIRRIRGGQRSNTTITFGRVENEPVLDDADLIQLQEEQPWDNARSVVPELVDVLTVMHANLGALDAIDHRSLAESDDVPNSARRLATETFGRIRHLDQATVPFLPDDLSKAWHTLLQLLDDLRRHGHGSSEPWPDVMLERNRRDVAAYVVMVRAALIDFRENGTIAAYREPPNLEDRQSL